MATLEKIGDVSVITLDDGKVNAMAESVSTQLTGFLEEVRDDSKAVLIQGREGILSAGFDLRIIQGEDRDASRQMIAAGFGLFLRMFNYPQPVVVACTGHAVAAGAILLMSADLRIGAEGDYKIGLNEVAIGLVVPAFLVEMARERLAGNHLLPATLLSTMYSPSGAVQAGFLDETAPAGEVRDRAMARAEHLAETLDVRSFRKSREILRGPPTERIRETLSGDILALLD